MAKEVIAYMLTKDGRPLMPCHSNGRVRRMVESGKARIVRRYPLTLQRTEELKEEHTGRVILGIDPGRRNIGLCAITEEGSVLYAAELETRNPEIKKNMQKRAMYRRSRRNCRRGMRKRRAAANGTLFSVKLKKTRMGLRPEASLKKRKSYPLAGNMREYHGKKETFKFRFVWRRYLPSCQEPVEVSDIRNTEARFMNRKRRKAWLTPTAQHLLQTHINAISLVMKLLPVTDIVLEDNQFDISGMMHPGLEGKGYQQGPLYGVPGRNREEKIHAAVSAGQGGHCIFCKKEISHYHHVIPRSRGGRDSVENEAGVCLEHHEKLHKDRALFDRMVKKKEKLNEECGMLSVLNQVLPYLKEYLGKLEPFLSVRYTHGWDTKRTRMKYLLPKTHTADAWCIAASTIPAPPRIPDYTSWNLFYIMQFRRHDRSCVKRLEGRKYLDGGKVVAVNRKKSIAAVPGKDGKGKEKAQTADSLAEYREKLVNQYLEGHPGENVQEAIHAAERKISTLEVVPGRKCCQNRKRVLPGSCYRDGKGWFILQGTEHYGQYAYPAYAGLRTVKGQVAAKKKKCTALKKKYREGSEEYLELERQIRELESLCPEEKRIPVSKEDLLYYNSGLVYVKEHIKRPA